MQLGRRGRRLRIAVPLILLIMILMRLVWMQLRAYPAVPEARALVSLDVVHRGADSGCPHAVTRAAPVETGTRRAMLQAAYEWVASPGYVLLGSFGCQGDLLEAPRAVRLNEWILVSTVILATLMTRFITSSWTVSLIVAAMLFSRGRLLADIGSVSTDAPIMLFVTAWLASCAHFLRTGATLSLAGAIAAALLATAFDRSLAALCLVMPALLLFGYVYRRRLARPVIRRLRGTHRRYRAMQSPRPASGPAPARIWPPEEVESSFGRFARSMRWMLGMEFPPVDPSAPWRPSYERGSLFRTINVPFLLWAYSRRRWLRLSFLWLAAGVAALALLVGLARLLWGPVDLALVGQLGSEPLAQQLAGLGTWLWSEAGRIDLHFGLSLAVLVLCAVQSPAAGLSSFLECTWLALLAVVTLGTSAFLADGSDVGLARALAAAGVPDPLLLGLAPRPVLLWLEPVVLSLGVAGLYNLMKVMDTRVAERS